MSSKKLLYAALVSAIFGASGASAAVDVIQGGATASYPTLKEAFENIRADEAEVLVGEDESWFNGIVPVTSKVRLSAGGKLVHLGEKAGFRVVGAGASLTLENLTFLGHYPQDGFVRVEEGGELVLGENAVLTDLVTDQPYGNVTVVSGRLEMSANALIDRCRSRYAADILDNHVSAAVYLAGEGAEFEMKGGQIRNGLTARDGGGVFVGAGAVMKVSGDATVSGNRSGSLTFVPNDVYLWNTDAKLVLDGELTGSIGVRYRTIDPEVDLHNTNGYVFASIASAAAAEASAPNFFNDCDLTLVGAVSGSDLVWTARSTLPESVPEAQAKVRLTDLLGGSNACYRTVNDAFAVAASNGYASVLFELLDDDFLYSDATLPLATNIVFAGGGHVLGREGDFGLLVKGQSFRAEDVVFSGASGGSVPFLRAIGVSTAPTTLTLGGGSVVRDVTGDGKREAGAVYVNNGALFVMEEGSAVADCTNLYRGTARLPAGCGGGVLVDVWSRAELKGGSITGCSAVNGGGIYFAQGATAEVSGSFAVSGNATLDGEPNDLAVARRDSVTVLLAAPFTGSVAYSDGTSDLGCAFGRVASTNDWNWRVESEALASSAALFRNAATDEIGRAVTNATAALLVWGNAVDADGRYTDAKGADYYLVDGAADTFAEDPALLFESTVYTGKEQVAAEDGYGYVFDGASAVTAGVYVATASLRDGFVWADGSSDPKTFAWTIEKADYDVTGLVFEDMTVDYDGRAHSIRLSNAVASRLSRQGVRVTYEGNSQTETGSYAVTVSFAGDAANYNAIAPMTATLTIVGETPDPPDPPEPEPVPCRPFGFSAIERGAAGSWTLTLTNLVSGCTYDVLAGADLENWTKVTTLAPETDGEMTVTVPAEGDVRLWNATGHDGMRTP